MITGVKLAWHDAHDLAQPHMISYLCQAEGRQPHEEVRKFYAGHYSSNIMKGAVMGRHSLDELEAMVRAKFGDVGNVDLHVPEFNGDALSLQHFSLCDVMGSSDGYRCTGPL